jgi:hypothetical protein
MFFPLLVAVGKPLRLAHVGLDAWIAVKTEGKLTFLKGFALDYLIRFAGDGVAKIAIDGSNTAHIAIRGFTFESH